MLNCDQAKHFCAVLYSMLKEKMLITPDIIIHMWICFQMYLFIQLTSFIVSEYVALCAVSKC